MYRVPFRLKLNFTLAKSIIPANSLIFPSPVFSWWSGDFQKVLKGTLFEPTKGTINDEMIYEMDHI